MDSLNDSADALRDRFIVEQEYVRKCVDLLERRTSLNPLAINGVIGSLVRYGLAKEGDILKHGGMYGTVRGQLNSLADLQKVNLKLQALKPGVQKALEEAQTSYDPLDRRLDLESLSPEVRTLVSECIELFDTVYTEGPTESRIEEVRNGHIRSLKEQEIFQDVTVHIGDSFGSYEELVDSSIKYVNEELRQTKIDDLYRALDSIEDLDILVRMARGDAEINVLRQGFITLSTVFDATVFDLVKLALERDFFNLIALFGKQDKVSLDRISRYSSFEEFRDAVIEEQLKSKYLREILFILQGHKVTLTDAAEGDEFIHLLEMVLRRNIHIHNRGVVDSKYLETNESGVPRYNVYNLAPGAVAHIDYEYWERANRLSLNCVRLITDWVNTLPKGVW